MAKLNQCGKVADMNQQKHTLIGSARELPMRGDRQAFLFEDSYFPTLDRRILAALLTIDLLLIAVHIVSGIYFDKIPVRLNIALDFSLGEFFNYGKWAVILFAVVLVGRRTGNPALHSCAALFAVMLADDSLQIHERIGSAAVKANLFDDGSWANGQTLAEIAVWATMAVLLVPVVLLGFLKSTRAQLIPAFRFLALIALFAVFGGVIDALHQPFSGLPYGPQLADLIEDGGEMIVASMIVAHALWLLGITAPKQQP